MKRVGFKPFACSELQLGSLVFLSCEQLHDFTDFPSDKFHDIGA